MQLHYQTYGQGSPLVILHGLFGSADNWQTISRRLADRFQVFAVDQRNHGHSPHAPDISYPAMAEDLREFLNAHRLSQVDLLGHSMGGKTAMQFALRHPEAVKRLVVVDIAPRAYPPRHRNILTALLSLDLAAFSTRQQIDQALAHAITDRAVRQFLLKSVERTPEGTFRWRINLPSLNEHYDLLRAPLTAQQPFRRPALFVRGEKSEYLVPDDFGGIRQWFPRAEFAAVPQAGHWVHAEAPEYFFRLVLQFLERGATGPLPHSSVDQI